MEQDVLDKVHREFDSEQDYVIRILESLKAELEVSDRFVRCVLHLSRGNLDKFNKALEMVRIDWRDIINTAESYPFEFITSLKC